MILSMLPLETLLDIIQLLPLTTIASLSALSKSWAAFMATNESSIYYSISKLHGYIKGGGPVAPAPPGGWKAWVIQKFQVELRWIGRLPGNSYKVKIPGISRYFFEIKVDEENGYLINTFLEGGLAVSDIHDYRALWSLDEEFCEGCIRCEYDEGYIVFEDVDNYQVWRRRIDVLNIPGDAWPSGSQNKPDEKMIEGNRLAEDRYLNSSRDRDSGHLRGQFSPWARLQIPERSRSFRLTRRTLLVSSAETAFLYDVEQAELQQTIDVYASSRGHVRCVDINEQHIFIVRTLNLTVYDRATGSSVLVIPAGQQPWDFYAKRENQWRRENESFNHGELGFQQGISPQFADRVDHFHAARVSPCGKHLSIMTLDNNVILVQDFWRLLPASSSSIPFPITLKDIGKQVDLNKTLPPWNTGGCLAYGHGKVAVMSTCGIYVLILDSTLDRFGEIDFLPIGSSQPRVWKQNTSWQNLRMREVDVRDVEVINSRVALSLELTETKLYLSVFPHAADEWDAENTWCCDFASSPPFTPVQEVEG